MATKTDKFGFFFLFVFVVFCFFWAGKTVSAATVYVNSSTGNDSTGNGSAGTPYKTFTKAYASSTAGDILDLTGTFTWTDAAETADAATSGFTLAKNLTLQGHGAGNTIFQSATASTTADRRVFTINSGVTVSIDKVTIRNGRVTGSGNNGGGISNSGVLTITDSDIVNNLSTGYFGGGIVANATTTIDSCSIRNNTAYYGGGGIEVFANTALLVLTNSTVSHNFQTSSSGYLDGGGINIRYGSAVITNSTIMYNSSYGEGGVYLDGSGGSGALTIENTIIANNILTGSPNYVDFGKYSGATVTNNGYNIVGYSSGYTFSAAGDWTDGNRDGVFAKTGGGSGSLANESIAGVNDNPDNTYTLATQSGSISIDNGTTTANSTVSVPSADQRGAGRNGSADIGAFEYNGTGLSITAPSVQASSIVFSSVEYNRMNLGWTSGNGSRRAVFLKAGSGGAASPVDGTGYAASTVFASGAQIGSSGWYAVYDGLGSSVAITGLTQGVTYSAQVFEYNGIQSGNQDYLTDAAANNPNSQQTHAVATFYINASTGNDSTGDGSSGSPYKTFHKGYTTALAGDTLDVLGTFTWTDAGETGDAVTSGYTIAKDLIILGHGPDLTIFQPSTASSTSDRRGFTINSGVTVSLKYLTVRNGQVSSSSNSGGAVLNSGTVLLLGCDFNNNRSSGYFGGALANVGSMTLDSSSVEYNTAYYAGGGLVNIASNALLDIINSTIAYNQQTANVAYTDGGGINIRYGTTTITSSLVAYNTAYGTGGVYLDGSGSTGGLIIKDSIIINNIYRGSPYYVDFGKYTSSAMVDNGYNLIGYSSGYTWSGTGDWRDTSRSGVYSLVGSSATGTPGISSVLAYNDNVGKTYTLAITSGSSVAVNNGSSAANGTVSIPATDQRGASRNGNTDIGPYEYNGGGLSDITGPVVNLNAPTNASVASGASVSLSATATDSSGVAGIKFYLDGSVLIGSEVTATSSPDTYSAAWNSTLIADGSHSLFAVGRDISGNFSTTSSISVTVDNNPPTVSFTSPPASSALAGTVVLTATTSDVGSGVAGVKFYYDNILIGAEDASSPFSVSWNTVPVSNASHTLVAVARDNAGFFATSSPVSVIVDNAVPVISSVAATPSAETSQITWNTNEAATSQVEYGLTSVYTASSTLDASTTTSHTVILSGLSASTLYHFRVLSKDVSNNLASSSDGTFTTNSAADLTSPSIGLALPAAGSILVGSAVSLAATSTDNIAVAGVKFYYDSTNLIGGEITATSSPNTYAATWNSTLVSDGAHTLIAVARDTSNNQATSAPISITINNTPPNFVALNASSTLGGAVITWTSSALSSTQVNFGLTAAFGSSTPEADTSPRVASHSVALAGLPACAMYYFQAQGKNSALVTATSTTGTFVTLGCTGGASVSASGQGSIATSTGGTLTQGALTLTVPTGFTATSSSAIFQAHQLNANGFFAAAGAPSGKSRAGNNVFNLKALKDATTTLTTFLMPITVVLSYSPSDISGLDESSLWIYRYGSSAWSALDSCSVDTGLRKVSCQTSNFSDFALFGNTQAASGNSQSSAQGGGLPMEAYEKPRVPLGGFILDISRHDSGHFLVKSNAGADVKYIALSADPAFKDAGQLPYSQNLVWDYCWPKCPEKISAVYAMFYTQWGQRSEAVSSPVRQGVPISAPGSGAALKRALQKGGRGADVARLQLWLSQDALIYPEGLVTGSFGALTQAAVRRFQLRHGIAKAGDSGFGRVGPKTLAKLNDLFAE